MIVIDTNVLVYAVGADHPLREPCRRLIANHAAGSIELATTIEVIQELVHVRSRRRSRQDAVAVARRFVTALQLISTDRADLELGLTLCEGHPDLNAFDAVLAAVALNHGAEALVSADRAFGLVRGLRWVDPATDSLDELLTAG